MRTAGGPRPRRPRKGDGVGDFPVVPARATCCDRGPVAVRYLPPTLYLARIGTMNSPQAAARRARFLE